LSKKRELGGNKMDLKNLDFNSIIKMYQKNNDSEKLENMIILALDNYSEEKSDSDYAFLNNRTLEYETIMRYKNNLQVLTLLARKAVGPRALVWDLIYPIADYKTIRKLVEKNHMLVSYLEKKVIELKQPSYYLSIFSNEALSEINYKKLVSNFLLLETDLYDEKYLCCIKVILTKCPYDELMNIRLAERLTKGINSKCEEIITEIINYFLKKYFDDFENFLKTRKDLLYLVKHLKKEKIVFQALEDQYTKALEKLKEGTIDIAWSIYIHEITPEDRINILNNWALNNQITLFETYFGYLTTDDPDYENDGVFLDEEYRKQVETAEIPASRVRKP